MNSNLTAMAIVFTSLFTGAIALFLLVHTLYAMVISIVFAWPLQWLWNHLAQQIFNLPPITYWQAVGLILICRVLQFPNLQNENKP